MDCAQTMSVCDVSIAPLLDLMRLCLFIALLSLLKKYRAFSEFFSSSLTVFCMGGKNGIQAKLFFLTCSSVINNLDPTVMFFVFF